jgi:hypothetical protein
MKRKKSSFLPFFAEFNGQSAFKKVHLYTRKMLHLCLQDRVNIHGIK